MSYIHLNQGTIANHDTLPVHCIIHLVRGWRVGWRLYAVAEPYSGFCAIPCSLGDYHVTDAWIHSEFEPNSTTLISVSALTFSNRYKKTDGFICYWGWWLPNVLTEAPIISISKLLKYFTPLKFSYQVCAEIIAIKSRNWYWSCNL